MRRQEWKKDISSLILQIKKHQLQLKIYKLIPKEGNVEKSNCLPYKKAKFFVICESNTHMSPLNV